MRCTLQKYKVGSTSKKKMSVPEIKIDGEANILNRPIGVRFSTAQLENARARADALGRLNRSFTKGKSNIYGMLGEEIVANFVAGTIADTYDYDIVDPSGLKIDVKTKKTTSCEAPASHFTATVWGGNTKQKVRRVRVCARVHRLGQTSGVDLRVDAKERVLRNSYRVQKRSGGP